MADAPFMLEVEAVAAEAEDVVSLVLADPAGAPLPAWAPGAHIDVVTPGGIERQYSLCGDPADAGRWRIAVLREPDSRGGSEWLHTLRAGDRVQVQGPRNHFPLEPAPAYVFVAGGIGITPILAMVAEVAARGVDWRLVYGGRRAASMAFTGELARHGDRVTLWPADERGLIELDALLGAPAAAPAAGTAAPAAEPAASAEPAAGTAVYCCGPEPLLAAVEQRCAAWPAGALHVERFHPRPGALDGARSAFEVVLDHSGLTLAVGPDESIAEVVERAGVDVPTSCREGTCGTCETVVLEGEPDHRDSFLSPEERAANETMMICCSRVHGQRIVLDL